ncbi:DinB family protein [Tuwongella immobilis]|uniref:DinB-like domain-containing protein n=1 Tax=Tuwongella immobilis TaxID=692036 RepID=A0A6C2YIP1_9BACT|nr:DinB family protein [Tuwongella immobilis]VIP01003.1 Uncharacterized protein OS=Rhodopirellula sallentina SM41 GN=RSSM_04700 PE=4 SV=1: DinB_2 [Tuwongella immobilis]VTR97430.1 Uncharacterized protein OS=Rhodopirellula sallentina SM41 GN=RSSM_04700 PE=4 SV=1: DinB_2 [Tuwongella immobilis]
MPTRDLVKLALDNADLIQRLTLSDLSDADFRIRTVAGANHLAWQIGHLIVSESDLHACVPGANPYPLPEGFAERHRKETAGNDNPTDFLTKDEYLALWANVRNAVRETLQAQTDEQLLLPNTSKSAGFAPLIGSIFLLISNHAMMHMGQASVLRRKLGKPNSF